MFDDTPLETPTEPTPEQPLAPQPDTNDQPQMNAAPQPPVAPPEAADTATSPDAAPSPHPQPEATSPVEPTPVAPSPEPPTYQAGRVYSPQSPNGQTYAHAAYQTSDGTAYYEPPRPPRAKRRKSGISWAGAVALLLLVAMIATAGGFGGACLYAHLHPGESVTGEKTVLYQSVIRTVGDGETVGGQLSVSQAAAIAAPSVVEITTESVSYGTFFGQYTTSGAGSGVILSEDGLIVTNYHVVSGATNITVTLKSGETYEATLVGGDEQNDLALLRIKANDLDAAVLGSSSALVVGEGVVAVGNPLGELGGTVTNGIISALDREIEVGGTTYTLLQTNAAVNPGNSGGGLFNMNGELIGIVNAKISENDVEGLGFAIPIDHAKGIIEELAAYGYVRGRMDLGMQLIEINDATTAMYYNVTESGVYISSVSDNTLGFRPGDLILSIDGTEILTMKDMETLLEGHQIGDALSVTVKRRVSRKDYRTEVLTLVIREQIPAFVH